MDKKNQILAKAVLKHLTLVMFIKVESEGKPSFFI